MRISRELEIALTLRRDAASTSSFASSTFSTRCFTTATLPRSCSSAVATSRP
jgi:hypothetical protein